MKSISAKSLVALGIVVLAFGGKAAQASKVVVQSSRGSSTHVQTGKESKGDEKSRRPAPWEDYGFGINKEDAESMAIENVQRKAVQDLLNRDSGLNWPGSEEYIVKHTTKKKVSLSENDPKQGFYKAVFQLEMTENDYRELLRLDREYRSELLRLDRESRSSQRQVKVFQLFVGIITLLGGFGIYYRVTDGMKGRKSTVAIGLLGAVCTACFGVWWLT